MNITFGSFIWNCWKDVKPDPEKYIYANFPNLRNKVYVGTEDFFRWDDMSYWCYVFIPDAPKIEKKMTLEERIEKLEKEFEKAMLGWE